ncbi:MAG: hypothetical protein RR285_11700 [Acinetobacter sp.]
MSIDKLISNNAMDLIGGQNSLTLMNYLPHLDETTRQMSLKSSKPFQTKGDVLTPTAALIQLNCMIKTTYSMIQGNYAPPLNSLSDDFAVTKGAHFLFVKINQIIMQNIWFDILEINQHPHKQLIHSTLDQLWNEIRGYSASSEAESDANKRKKLIADQAKENSRIVGRLLTTHTNILMTRVSYFISTTGNTEQLEVNEIEKAIVKLKSKLINEFQQLNQEKLFCIQWRIQRTLYGQYYLNMLVYHDDQYQLQLPQDQNLLSHTFDDEQQTIKLDLSNVLTQNIKIERDNFQGTNLAEWKVIFNSMLYPVKYYYYQSKVISAKFEYIVY